MIAAEGLSINADGNSNSAGGQVDAAWREQVDCALAILRTLREPTPEMVEAGRSVVDRSPEQVWNAMVRAAIGADIGA